MQIWKLALGLGVMVSVLVVVSDQAARAHQSCVALAEWFDEEAISSKGRRAPNLEQARRIKREGVELCATGREGDAAALLVTALHMIGVATADSAYPSTLAGLDCSELVEIFDIEARGSSHEMTIGPHVISGMSADAKNRCSSGECRLRTSHSSDSRWI